MNPGAVPPERLGEQLAAMAAVGARMVGLTEALSIMDDDTPVVALTFDDGFADFATDVVPLLAEYGARATLYPAVGHCGLPAAWLGRAARQYPPILSWAELAAVAAAGVEIGSHALLHHPLDVLPTPQLEYEVRHAAALLRERLGVPVASFAYPHGYHDARVRAAVAAAGHSNACVVGRTRYRPGGSRYAIPRLEVTGEHTGAGVLRLAAGEFALNPLARRVAGPPWRAARRLARDLAHRPLT